MQMDYVSFDVYNSILEDNEGWINNMGNNLIGSMYDPIFNTYSAAPYSCDYYSSPAIGAGDASFITSSSFYDSNIMDYDVVNNMYRYFDLYAYKTDIGAYQNGYDDGTHLYSVGPVMSAPQRNNRNTASDKQAFSAINLPKEAILTIYDVSGKIVYTASATDGLDAFPNTISSGMYVAIVASKEGQEIASKKIIIP